MTYNTLVYLEQIAGKLEQTNTMLYFINLHNLNMHEFHKSLLLQSIKNIKDVDNKISLLINSCYKGKNL